jgi:hypothetical protein
MEKKEKVKQEEKKVEKEPVTGPVQQQQGMTKEQAFVIIARICNNYKGTLQEHQTIQQALTMLK